MATHVCQACGADVPNGVDVCGGCGWQFIHSSMDGQTVVQSSVHDAMKQSVVERVSSRPTNALAVRPAETVYGGLGVVLVSDISASMTEHGKIESSSEASLELVEHLDTPDIRDKVWIGEILFSSGARVAVPMQPLAEARMQFRTRGPSDCQGGTNVDGGLKLAEAQLNVLGTQPSRGRVYRLVLLLSDGCSNEGSDPRGTARTLKSDRLTRIVTVGFGPDRDEQMLREIASPGLYFEAQTSDVLRNLYSSFQQAVSSSVTEGEDPADYFSDIA